MSFEIAMDCSSDVEGIEVTRHMIEPSCKVGMNSLPRKGNSTRLTASAVMAEMTTVCLFERLHSSNRGVAFLQDYYQ